MGKGHPGHGFRLSFRPRVHGEKPGTPDGAALVGDSPLTYTGRSR